MEILVGVILLAVAGVVYFVLKYGDVTFGSYYAREKKRQRREGNE